MSRHRSAARSKGLTSLPDELCLEVVSHLPAPVAVPTDDFATIDVDDYLARQQTLRDLSQTCRSLRRVFLPLVWQRIEVYKAVKTTSGVVLNGSQYRSQATHVYANKRFAQELLRQLNAVRSLYPTLAHRVRYVIKDRGCGCNSWHFVTAS